MPKIITIDVHHAKNLDSQPYSTYLITPTPIIIPHTAKQI